MSVGRASSRARAGVTLIEMLVVLCIVGLVVSVTAPSIAAGLDSVRLATATSSVAGFLNAAVTRVERRQQPIEVIIQPSQSRIVIYSNEPGYTRDLKLPVGVTIASVLPAELGEETGADRSVLLLPGATAPGIGVMLANQHGSRRIVRLDPMTGFPRVETVASQ